MPRALRPSLFRPIKVRTLSTRPPRHSAAHPTTVPPSQVVMTDGSTFHVPSAIRQVSKVLQLERDPANHPLYLVRKIVARALYALACASRASLTLLRRARKIDALYWGNVITGQERRVGYDVATRGGAVGEIQEEGQGLCLRRRARYLRTAAALAYWQQAALRAAVSVHRTLGDLSTLRGCCTVRIRIV